MNKDGPLQTCSIFLWNILLEKPTKVHKKLIIAYTDNIVPITENRKTEEKIVSEENVFGLPVNKDWSKRRMYRRQKAVSKNLQYG